MDFAHVNPTPGPCGKCSGSGLYRWGAVINGRAQYEGTCWSCQGAGRQTRQQIRRNRTFNAYRMGSAW